VTSLAGDRCEQTAATKSLVMSEATAMPSSGWELECARTRHYPTPRQTRLGLHAQSVPIVEWHQQKCPIPKRRPAW